MLGPRGRNRLTRRGPSALQGAATRGSATTSATTSGRAMQLGLNWPMNLALDLCGLFGFSPSASDTHASLRPRNTIPWLSKHSELIASRETASCLAVYSVLIARILRLSSLSLSSQSPAPVESRNNQLFIQSCQRCPHYYGHRKDITTDTLIVPTCGPLPFQRALLRNRHVPANQGSNRPHHC